MTPTLTIEEAKNKAAQEFGFEGWAHLTLESDMDIFVKYHDRAMEIYAASALSSVREKLPDSQALFNKANEARYFKPESMAYEEGAQWAINQVKELLK